MNHKLSIIIPCYNCSETLEEALSSVFTQKLTIPFEVIMVDDGSSDQTAVIMRSLAKKYSEAKCIFHDQNRGGGAARNTGIRASTGDLIFCLDSDNFFPPETLQKMIDFLNTKKLEGSVIHERRYFFGRRSKKYQSHFNPARPIILADMFNKSQALLDNFLYTRAAYDKAGGYPEHHGFDTQCFELRFLGNKLRAEVCPGSVFYHRLATKNKSYFERVYENGDFSKNIYLIMEDIMPLLSRRTIKTILEFDIFKKNTINHEDLKSCLENLYEKNPARFFSDNIEISDPNQAFSSFIVRAADNNCPEDLFVGSIGHYRHQDYSLSLSLLSKMAAQKLDTPILYFNVIRNIIGLTEKCPRVEIEKNAQTVIASLVPIKHKSSIGYRQITGLLKVSGLGRLLKRILTRNDHR